MSRNAAGAKRYIIGILAICLLTIGALAACSGTDDDRAAAAYVGNQVIYEDEITDYTQTFRGQRGYEDDTIWAQYLTEEGLTGKTWRERVIRQMADRILVEDKAAELGVTPDQDAVNGRIAALRQQAGVPDDDTAWRDYLAQTGQTPEGLREDLEFSSLEQQVVSAEVDLSSELRSQMCDDYIHTNLSDQVVRHYYAFEYALDDEKSAETRLDELADLEASDLNERFLQSNQAVDLGWDFTYGESAIDPELSLRKAKLDSGQLYGSVLAGSDALRVVLCAERIALEGVSYDEIRSESLRDYIAGLTLASQWAALTSQYLDELETKADVQVEAMPEGLPYDVVE